MSTPFDSTVSSVVPLEARDDDPGKQLEAYFLRRVLAEVKIGQGGMLSGGFAGETFQQMFNDAIADSMAEAGGLGISDAIMGQLEGDAARLANRSPAARDARHRIERGELRSPVSGTTTSPFGARHHPVSGEMSFHSGVDIGAPEGKRVSAAAAGVVVRAERAGDYGRLVVLKHAGGLETRYAHLSRIDVKVGDRVELGAAVGAIGQSGNATGPHLHFEVRRDGVAADPSSVLAAADRLTERKLSGTGESGEK